MKRLINVILCSSVFLLTVPMSAEARPQSGNRSFNPGVHRNFIFPSQSPSYRRNSRSCYDCRYSTPYRQNYRRGGGRIYQNGGYGYDRGYNDYRRGRRRTYQNRDYRYNRQYNDYPRSRSRSRSRIRIEYEGSF